MKQILEVLIFVIVGVILLRFGYTLFFSIGIPMLRGRGGYKKFRKPRGESFPGEPQTCPVCSAKLYEGQLVKSMAFPSINGGQDRFMHIRGCYYCLKGNRERVCPVCGIILKEDEILISRLYEHPGRRSHVHVIGCSHCKRTGHS